MTELASSRRFELLEILGNAGDGISLGEAAERLGVDERTVRRDVDAVQEVLMRVGQVVLVRGRLQAASWWHGELTGGGQAAEAAAVKAALARAAVGHIPDGSAVVLTAGTTTLAVAREIREAQISDGHPRNLIVFTNSLPALLQFVAGGVSTGVLGEVYNPVDRAFHSHELRTRFQASIAVVGASGIVVEPSSGTLSLCSDRVEEAAFMRQLLATVPEILVVAEAAKIGKRHPWSFTSDGLLVGKSVHIVTSSLERKQKDALAAVADGAGRGGWSLSYEEVE